MFRNVWTTNTVALSVSSYCCQRNRDRYFANADLKAPIYSLAVRLQQSTLLVIAAERYTWVANRGRCNDASNLGKDDHKKYV